MKLIGIDYGRRRIGMAVTDENGSFIRSLPTIDRKINPEYKKAILDAIVNEHPTDIVIGLPLSLDDSETVMSLEIRNFAENVIAQTNLPIHYIDESLTSVRAHDIIRMKKKKDRRVKENVDRIAACLILETFLQDQGLLSN